MEGLLHEIRLLTEPLRDGQGHAAARFDPVLSRGLLMHGMNIEDIAKVLQLMLGFINCINEHYGTPRVQSAATIQIGAASQLLSVVRDGLALHDARERVGAGRMSLHATSRQSA